MHDLKTMKIIGEIQDSIIYDVDDQPVDVREQRLNGWDTCSRPVICIFDGQFDITGLGNITAWHHSWGITVVPVDKTTAWDLLKARALDYDQNHGCCPGLCDDPPELEHEHVNGCFNCVHKSLDVQDDPCFECDDFEYHTTEAELEGIQNDYVRETDDEPEPETTTENPFVEVEMVNINNTLTNTAARFTSAAQYCKHVIRYDDYDGAACGQESEEWDIVPCSFENCPRINA